MGKLEIAGANQVPLADSHAAAEYGSRASLIPPPMWSATAMRFWAITSTTVLARRR